MMTYLDKNLCTPQDNLDCYYNSEWKDKNAKLLDNKQSINNFSLTQDQINEEMVHFILNAQNNGNLVHNNMIKLRQSYFSRKGNYDAIKSIIQHINGINNIPSLAKVIKLLNDASIYSFFTIGIIPHIKDPSIYTYQIGDIDLTLSTKEEYHEGSRRLKTLISTLFDVHPFLVKKWGYFDTGVMTFVKHVVALEIFFSQVVIDHRDYDPAITNTSSRYSDFLATYDCQDFWKILISEYHHPDSFVSFSNPNYLSLFRELLQMKYLPTIKDYLAYSVLRRFGVYTEVAPILFRISIKKPSEKLIFIHIFYDLFGYYLQDIYNKKYADEGKFRQIREMFKNLKGYVTEYFQRTDFFSEPTRKEALRKIDYLDIIIGSLKHKVDMKQMPELSYDFYHNMMILSSFYNHESMKYIGKPVDRYNLSVNNDIYSFIVNGYYDPHSNMIYIPTSITYGIFYDKNEDPIYNYGSLGTIIGHEMMHCFDIHGSKFDEVGHIRDWWTKEDYQKFHLEYQKIIRHYSQIYLDGIKINYMASVGENLADICGLKVSLRTYLRTYQKGIFINNKLTIISDEQKKHLQKFFEKWVRVFRSISKKEFIKHLIQVDVHAPDTIRVNAPFAHIDEYYLVYDLKPGNINFIKAEERTRLLDF